MVHENEWKPLLLYIVDDFRMMKIAKSKPETGDWPPKAGDILIERAALRVAEKKIGDNVVVCLPGGPQRQLTISGTNHDPGEAPAWMEGMVYGYATKETLKMFGKTTLNEVLITVAEKPLDKVHIRGTVKTVTDYMEQQGYPVRRIEVPEPGHHPHQTQLKSLLFLLEAFGGLSFILSTVLLITLIGAIMAQQIRQVGIMKAIGARTSQMVGMYLSGALLLGIISVSIGLPIGLIVARLYSNFAAEMLNFEIVNAGVPMWTYALLISISLTTPVLSAFYPVYRGGRVSVREAISDYGITQWQKRRGLVDRVLSIFRGLPRPFLLSLRNTFRRRGRIALTLVTLAIGGAMFMTALNTGASITKTIAAFQSAMRYDLQVSLVRPVPFESTEYSVKSIPGVAAVEGGQRARASLVYQDGSCGNEFTIMAPQPGTKLLRLNVVEGRWLTESDSNALVVNHIFMSKEPHLKVGDEVVLQIGTLKKPWRIVGVVRQIGQPTAFANREYLADLTGQKGLVSTLLVVTTERSVKAHLTVSEQIEKELTDQGGVIQNLISIYGNQKILEDHFVVLTMLLLFMSVLIVIVGGLALASTMSIQVIERTKEIGVMRAIGASNSDLLRSIITEGLVIGALSWILATALALPISKHVGDLFGTIFLQTTLDFAVSPVGFILWLGIVAAFSLFASFFPARKATRLTVRETLAYE